MRIVLAPDSWKECLAAPAVAAALARGLRRACPAAELVELPVADGGEGTVAALVAATGGSFRTVMVRGPLGAPLAARFGFLGDGTTAVVEMAAAAGLELLPPAQRDPLAADTFGVGELLRTAADAGAARIIVGLGGSATTDAGAGLARALGHRLLDEHGAPIPPGGGGLAKLSRWVAADRDRRFDTLPIDAACDVDNPLCGPHGAARVFSPQKNATPLQAEALDANLRRWAEIVRRDLGRAVAEVPGAGAAGGLGAGLLALTAARLRPGIDLALDAMGFDRLLAGADLCIASEGALDATTLRGKAVAGVARRCAAAGVPCLAFAGRVDLDAEGLAELGLAAAFGIAPRPATLAESQTHAAEWLANAAEQTLRLWLAAGGQRPRGGMAENAAATPPSVRR